VGTESQAEYLDLELHGTPAAEEVAEQIRRELPEGFRLLSCEPGDAAAESLSRTIRAIEYRVELPDGAPDPVERLAEFASRAEAAVLREREGKAPVRIDLKSALQALDAAVNSAAPGIGVSILHLTGLAAAFGLLARVGLRSAD